MLIEFKNKLIKRGSRHVVLEGIVLCVLFIGLRSVFNLLLLPALFPGADLKQDFTFSSASALFLALAYWLGLPYFSLFTTIGLMLSQVLGLHYYLIEGGSYPSITANVLTTVSQGSGFLIGGFIEYGRWLYKRIREIRFDSDARSTDSALQDEAQAHPPALRLDSADELASNEPDQSD